MIMGIKKETIEISLGEYNRLQEVDELMDALKCLGVDNWDGYYEAQEMVKEWNELINNEEF